jgi:hypothetical protein
MTMCFDLLQMLDNIRTFPAFESIRLRWSEESDATYSRRRKLEVL